MVTLVCPVTGEVLERRGEMLVAPTSGNAYPVVEGIPVLLPDEAERRLITGVDWSAPGSEGASRLGFYNSRENNDHPAYENPGRADLEKVYAQARCSGPALEIGSGRGNLQGIGDPYVALDYGFTLLQQFIDPRYQRVCGTAESLPFPADHFAFVFSYDALEHVPRADRALEEIHRVLQPRGVIYLKPAWHCRQYMCDGVLVRRYAELDWRKRITKFMLPVSDHTLIRAARQIPLRALRRMTWMAGGRKPTRFHFKRLRPDYSYPWSADSDACSSLDSHEATLFFHSRGYEILSPGPGAKTQLLARHIPLIARKP